MTLEELPTCQGQLSEVSLPEDWSARLHSALEQRRRRAFTNLVLAALHAGEELSARVLERGASLLPDARVLAAVAPRCSGQLADALLVAARDGRLGPVALLVALRLVARERPLEAAAWTRAMARRTLPVEAEDLLAAFADELGDADLNTVLEAEGLPYASPEARRDWEAFDALATDGVLACLPQDPPPAAVSGFTVRREGAKVGRNDLCPCGSGKKYKRCCLGREGSQPALSAEMLAAMEGPELVTLEGVPADLVPVWIDALVLRLELDRATELIEQHGCSEEGLAQALSQAAWAERDDLLPRLAAGAKELPLAARLRLAGPSERLDLVEEAARDEPSLELAYGTLDGGLPGLAVHLLRGLLPLASPEQAPELLATLLETRDRVGLAPVDPVEPELRRFAPWAGALETEADRQRDARERVEAELRAARVELSKLRAELSARPLPEEAKPESELPEQPEPTSEDLGEELQRLRAALAREKTLHKAVHEDRNRLRRQLREQEAVAAPIPEEVLQSAVEERDDEPVCSEVQPARVPRFEAAFLDALARLPEHNQRGALELIGRLAAGREEAFRLARPLRGMRAVWRVRLQRSYRILFQMDEGELRVLDIVHRQDLERRIRVLWRQ